MSLRHARDASRRTLTPSMGVALVALVAATSSTAYAAATISGANVRNSSLTGADVKNSSLTGADVKGSSITSGDIRNGSLLGRDFKAGELPVGAPGPKGDKGDPGTPGTPGATGPRGPSNGYFAGSPTSLVNLTAGERTIATRTVPAGDYIVQASGIINNNVGTATTATCRITAEATTVAETGILTLATSGAPAERAAFSLAASQSLGASTTLTLRCTGETGFSGNVLTPVIHAVRVESLN